MPDSQQRSFASPIVASYKGLVPDPELLDWIRSGAISGIVLFRDNCTDEVALLEATSEVRRVAAVRFHIMIDEEGGRVRRLNDAPASMRDLRDYGPDSPEPVAQLYARVADRLKGLRIDTLLAPVADIGNVGAAWLNTRTYSDSPHAVAAMVSHVVRDIQSRGVHACAKHFPGTGRVAMDPHHGPVRCAVTRREWEDHERIPFAAAIDAGVAMILVGHQIMEGFGSSQPACFDRTISSGILKDECGFSGLTLTDDLSMGAIAAHYAIEDAVSRADDAGCDLILVCNVRESQRRAVEHWARRMTVA